MNMNKYLVIALLLAPVVILVLLFVIFSEQPQVRDENAGPVAIFPARNWSEEISSRTRDFKNILSTELPDGTWIRLEVNELQIPLTSFLASLGASIPQPMKPFVDDEVWELYTCTNHESSFGKDVVLVLQLLDPQSDEAVVAERLAIRDSETFFPRLLSPVILPEISKSEIPEEVNFDYISNPGEFLVVRKATFNTETQGEQEIIYAWIDKEFVVGSSEQCVMRAQALLFDLSA